MERETIKKEVMAVIKDILGDDSLEIKESDHLIDDLEISSLEGFELVFSLEEQFDCTIEEKKVREFVTVEDIINFILDIKSGA